ncbi:MAG TPA: multicopper oxidase domain-containing protein [Acidobacteriaceae bacterium]|jgi:FtsP/CotA-like multicopper oxidase with cupredoxin domain
MNRRSFLLSASGIVAHPLLNSLVPASSGLLQAQQTPAKSTRSKTPMQAADHSLVIKPCTLEISPGVTIKTIGYNGQVPGPLLRLRQGKPVTIDVTNTTENPEIVHWHGLTTDSLNDGAMEEGSPMIPPGGHLRYNLTPDPLGLRWYHTHTSAGANLATAGYTGQFGFLLVEGASNPAHYDQEVFLAIHHWEPSFVPMVEMMQAQSANHPQTAGSDVGYKYATINQHRLGAGEPLRVKQGQKVLLRLLNASATENAVLALPGHTFRVIAMDGNPVPNPKEVEVISLAVAERVDAIVEMKSPGVWVLGSTLEKSRQMGLGIVVEYAGKSGPPVWKDPQNTTWDYMQFANTTAAPAPDETVTLALMDLGPQKDAKFDTWAINGLSWPDIEPLKVQKGKRYRLVFQNASGDQHPMHLHRHSFEVTAIGSKNLSGLKKDVVNVMPLDTVAVDFVADNPGDTLLHCHMQLHMDFGFMQLIKYV